ncbi:MAG: type transport system ATP-binding protein [Chloroflexota bacterium]|jgi:ABC-2 type transport system ATP-binding protein|nr:type transport system ATP-binding protein [Chloroflexota bacterium]
MTAVLEAHGFGKRYRRRNWALRGVDLTVPEGSITALVGPNGSGKSTLIRAWIGFERPTEGRLSTGGIDPRVDRKAAVARVGYVPQSPSLYGNLTIAEHIVLATTLRDGFDAALARHYIERLSIPLSAVASELSGGEQAQVGLALALGTRAKILLLDEPLASLDPLARREFLHVLVEAVRAEGHTALLSSHVITDIEQACDRLIVLGKGHTLLDLSIAEALAHHRVIEGPLPPTPADGVVGSFPSAGGDALTLVRVPVAQRLAADGPPTGRAATLEEVVIGHMAAGRVRRAATATVEAAA